MKKDKTEFDHVDIFEMNNCLIVPIVLDLYDEFLDQLKKTLLVRLQKSSLLGVIIDISAVNIIDSINLKSIIQLCEMTELMGKETVIIGCKPSVASAVAEFNDCNLNKIVTFISLEAAMKHFMVRRKLKHRNKQKTVVSSKVV